MGIQPTLTSAQGRDRLGTGEGRAAVHWSKRRSRESSAGCSLQGASRRVTAAHVCGVAEPHLHLRLGGALGWAIVP